MRAVTVAVKAIFKTGLSTSVLSSKKPNNINTFLTHVSVEELPMSFTPITQIAFPIMNTLDTK